MKWNKSAFIQRAFKTSIRTRLTEGGYLPPPIGVNRGERTGQDDTEQIRYLIYLT